MAEISINDNPNLLFNKLKSEFGRRFLDKVEIPLSLVNNINPSFPLREYQKRSFKAFISYLDESFDFKETPMHLLFNMATGSGKTLIMAGCILRLYEKGYRNFLFFSTSNPIIEKTKDNFIQSNSNKYLFSQNIGIDGKQVTIRQVENFEEANADDINIKFTTIHKLHRDLATDGENKITLDSFKNTKLVLIGDEAHHFNAKTNEQLEFEDIIKDETNWESTIARILRSDKDNILLEYTATIDWQNENIRDKYLSKCLIKYDLKEFREDGYSKEIKLFQSDKGIETDDLILQAVVLNQFRQDIATDNNINFKPVILFKANKTIEESKQNFEKFKNIINELNVKDLIRLKTFASKSEKMEKDENGFFADNNYLIEAFKYYDKQDKDFSNLIRKIKLNFAENKCLNVNEYAFDGKKQNTQNFIKANSETVSQENILNSLEHKDNEIRAIFAVNKLNEGWDVLNLFDIVRLYNTRDSKGNKAGKTTIAEAQLIGRGARYFPFSKDSKNKYQRKFDEDIKSPFRLLETLHYHSVYDSRYISELKSELIKTGAMEEEKIVKNIKLKDDFLQDDLFKSGYVYVNEAKKTDYREYKAWENMPLIKGSGFVYEIYTGRTKEDFALIKKEEKENITKKETKFFSLANVSKNIKSNALIETPFFEFNNLKKYIKDINSTDDFIKNYLDNVEITIKGFKDDIEAFSIDNQYKAVKELLIVIRTQLKDSITEYKGSKNFKPVAIEKTIKANKEIRLDKGNPRLENDMREYVKDKNWYVYDSVFGTSEEKSFIEMFANFIKQLEEKYTDIKLIRNERDVSIFDFHKGRRFEPDFILMLKDKANKKVNYQIFIEPKGNHLKNNELEKWKVDFLEEIKEMYKDKYIEYNENKKYRLIGLPFYNAQEEAKFKETFKECLL